MHQLTAVVLRLLIVISAISVCPMRTAQASWHQRCNGGWTHSVDGVSWTYFSANWLAHLGRIWLEPAESGVRFTYATSLWAPALPVAEPPIQLSTDYDFGPSEVSLHLPHDPTQKLLAPTMALGEY